MAMIEEFNEQTQREKVLAGFKGGPFNKDPKTYEQLVFANGHPVEVTEKTEAQGDLSGPEMGKPYSERTGKI